MKKAPTLTVNASTVFSDQFDNRIKYKYIYEILKIVLNIF